MEAEESAHEKKKSECCVYPFWVVNHDASAESREVCLLKQRVNPLSVLQKLRENRSSQRKCKTNLR